MQKTRIAVDVTPLLYRRTGIARITENLAAALLKLEPDLEVVGFGRRLLGLHGDLVIPGLPYHRLRLPRSAESVIQKFGLIERICKADIYHATDFYLPLQPSSLAIATVHDVLFITNPEESVDHTRLARWVPPFARRCAAIIAVSEFVKKEIERVLDIEGDRIHVVHPGVDPNVFSPHEDLHGLKQDLRAAFGLTHPYFLAVSCSTGRKNTAFLIEAYLELLKCNPRHDLVLVWDAPDDVLARYATQARIRFIKRVDDVDLRRLYCGATALVFPSLYEGFGLPVIEAMSCGALVIASRETSIPEAGGPAAIYINPRELGDLVRALTLLDNGTVVAEQWRPKLREQARRFTWAECARRTAEVYRAVLDRESHRIAA